jgi:hypothetical protein
MSKSFIKSDLPGFTLQLQNYSSKLPSYKTLLDLTTQDIDEATADSDYIGWLLVNYVNVEDHFHKWTALKDQMRNGTGGSVANIPTDLVIPAPPAQVPPNIQSRFSSLAARIKKHRNYTDTIGRDLGIIAVQEVFNPEEGKPKFTITLSSGGHPHLLWIKGKYQGVEIWKDSGDGAGYKKLDKDFRPDFTDKSDLPAAGSSAIWKYKMIYLYNDEHAGSWSDEVVVTVAGAV